MLNIPISLRYLGPFGAPELDTDLLLNWNTKARFEWVKADGVTEQRVEVNVACSSAHQHGVPKPESWKSKSATDVLNYAHIAELVANGHLPMSAQMHGVRLSCKLSP